MGQISDDRFAEFQSLLEESPEARKLFHRASRIDSFLRREAENANVDQREDEKVVSISSGGGFSKQPFFKPLTTVASLVLLSALTWTIAAQKRVVATLVSSDDAAWDSLVPTEPGAQITKGALRLASGIATIRFVSGAELTMEAPARLYAKGPKTASLGFGTVLVNANQEDDFVLETDHGQAAIRSGEFAVFARKQVSRIDFESISGKVVISHDLSRAATQLTGGATASMYSDRLDSSVTQEQKPDFERSDNEVLIRTNGRAATFIRNDNIHKWTRPEFLAMKSSRSGHGFDQRSAMGFDLSKIAEVEVGDASIQVEVVHSGHGLLSRLPKVNRFSIYGLVNASKNDWSISDRWEEAPSPEDGVKLLDFEIGRNQTSAVLDLRSEVLTNFIKERAGRSVTFIFVRETTNREGSGPGYTHAIASDSHPEASGPVLKITLHE